MPNDSITVKSDGVLEKFINNAQTAGDWLPGVIEAGLTDLGVVIEGKMRENVAQHRYTGALEDSITSEYRPMQVEIGPTAKRGNGVDAGVILELGTKPIPNLPWSPIKAWADFRGIPAGPVWQSIRDNGVKPHPFLNRTLVASEGAITNAAQAIADKAAERMVDVSGATPVEYT